MRARRLFLLAFVFLAPAVIAGPLTQLSRDERREIDERIVAFFRTPPEDTAVMNRPTPKWGIREGKWVHPNPSLAPGGNTANPLLALAGAKGSESFRRAYCDQILKRHFPKLFALHCVSQPNGLATIEANDKVESLTRDWMPASDVITSLDTLPGSGESKLPLWSDDYWRIRWGLTSYRYSEPVRFPTYRAAVDSYDQPTDWTALLETPIPQLAEKILAWSPSEKYDLTVGDDTFRLTHEQKKEGESLAGPDGNVEGWMGICHGWSAAAITVVPPKREVKMVGSRGAEVTWYPSDIKALSTLAWANGTYESNYVGGRCNSRSPEILPNGRIKDQKCFDNNPATFHLVLGNMIGKAGLAFVMDKTFDYEVWNQPVHSYRFTYFNPLDPAKQSKNWREVLVDYDATFKAQDRFQSPLTRGARRGGEYDDSRLKKVVGAITTVVYLVEIAPGHSPTPDEPAYQRETYTYDLEFEERNGELFPTGGEWHENSHPDFLWIPTKGSFARSNYDSIRVDFKGDGPPSVLVTETAKAASEVAMPLCRVVKELVKRASDEDTYPCP